jgi:hypothetical protein
MKTYQSTTEGTWVEILKVKLTEEQKAILLSDDDKKDLLSLIKSQREAVVPEGKAAELIYFYNTIKPVLKETDVYQLISADLLEATPFQGILNCRVNGEHTQIRF